MALFLDSRCDLQTTNGLFHKLSCFYSGLKTESSIFNYNNKPTFRISANTHMCLWSSRLHLDLTHTSIQMEVAQALKEGQDRSTLKRSTTFSRPIGMYMKSLKQMLIWCDSFNRRMNNIGKALKHFGTRFLDATEYLGSMNARKFIESCWIQSFRAFLHTEDQRITVQYMICCTMCLR